MGRAHNYTMEQFKFIEQHHKLKRKELHKMFVEKFKRTDVTVNAINSICKRNRWLSGRKEKGGSHYNDDVVEFISANRTMPRTELLEKVNTTFNLEMTYVALVNFCKRHGFSSGRKGHFGEHDGWKKGVQFNEQPIGYETKPDARGRVYVKVELPKTYRLKHHVVYEKHFGKLPEDHVIKFKDGNNLNFDPENLIAVHKGVTGFLTQRYKHHLAPQEVKPLLLTMAQIDHKIYQKEREDA